MPYFKTESFSETNSAGAELTIKVKIYVDSNGSFYCTVPEEIKTACGDQEKLRNVSYRHLLSSIKKYLKDTLQVQKTEELVIQYNIESHVSFALDDAGNIYPDALKDHTYWPKEKGEYGDHHACQTSQGGYSLCVGARALRKITFTYGAHNKVTYEKYYGKGDHLIAACPASILNSWCSFSLPENPKEIPYTDQAAEFFYDLMLGMAKLSKVIQEATFQQESLLKLIDEKQSLLPKL